MNRFKVEYHNGLVDIIHSTANSIQDVRLKHNEGVASITLIQPVRSAEPSKWKPYIAK